MLPFFLERLLTLEGGTMQMSSTIWVKVQAGGVSVLGADIYGGPYVCVCAVELKSDSR